MEYYILAVQIVTHNRCRLGLSTNDKLTILPTLRGQEVYIELPNEKISEIRQKTFFNHGNLVNITIRNWILQNNYVHIAPNNPNKFKFKLDKNIFKFITQVF